MSIFIPKTIRKPLTHHACQWCAKRSPRKQMYKLRDGPVDWWFCDDTHALEWLDYRHRTCSINNMLNVPPCERDLGGKTIDEWVRDELSQAHEGNA